jgi:hypothetical protein
MSSIENANNENHYKLLTVAIFIGIVGVYFRFAAGDASGHVSIYNWISNIILITGVGVALKGVFAILK